jgi:hypothetical protein
MPPFQFQNVAFTSVLLKLAIFLSDLTMSDVEDMVKLLSLLNYVPLWLVKPLC